MSNGKNGVFGGEIDCFKTYALICINQNDEDAFIKDCMTQEVHYISLYEGTGTGVLFDLLPEQIISLISRYNGEVFIYGLEQTPSTPYFYKKDPSRSFTAISLEPIYGMDDLEVIAPKCSDCWEDLYFNDMFRETLYTYLDDWDKAPDIE